tara:strand:+ start:1562 stop:1723 length:162 start_codon:yes stop_codon:yes gene_type:complete
MHDSSKYDLKKLPNIKKYSLKSISLSYINNFQSVIELDVDIINKNSNAKLNHA